MTVILDTIIKINVRLDDNYETLCQYIISTAGLSKFNIISKIFIPSTASILLLQKATKR
jgi:hypothetical protein